MPLFEFKHQAHDAALAAVRRDRCAYCGGDMFDVEATAHSSHRLVSNTVRESADQIGRRTARCGGWIIRREAKHTVHHRGMPTTTTTLSGASVCLKRFDLMDLNQPAQVIRDYLATRYDSRFDVHPKLMEEVVASVMRDHGF